MSVGRPRDRDILIMGFDSERYLKDLRKELSKAMHKIRNLLYKRVRQNIRRLPFKDNPVVMADLSITSDLERSRALLNSVSYEKVNLVGMGLLQTAVSAMGGDFRDTHIGIYYEFGTGYHEEPVPWVANLPQDGNIFRAGSAIVTRSKYVNGGLWRDLGGNLRITQSPRGGERDKGFVDYIGDDIEAYHWFGWALVNTKAEAADIIRQAVAKVSPLNYFRLNAQYNLTKVPGIYNTRVRRTLRTLRYFPKDPHLLKQLRSLRKRYARR